VVKHAIANSVDMTYADLKTMRAPGSSAPASERAPHFIRFTDSDGRDTDTVYFGEVNGQTRKNGRKHGF
jgi:hypothetical protein